MRTIEKFESQLIQMLYDGGKNKKHSHGHITGTLQWFHLFGEKKKNQKNMSMKSSYSGYWVIDGGWSWQLLRQTSMCWVIWLFGELRSQRSPAQPIFLGGTSLLKLFSYMVILCLWSLLFFVWCYLYIFKADLRNPLCPSYLVISYLVKAKKVLQFCERLP